MKRVHILKRSLAAFVVVIFLYKAQFVRAQSLQAPPKQDSMGQFVVGPRAVLMPKGAFLLIRKGKAIGAVRFTSIEQGSEVGVGRATYESYFQGDGSGLLSSAKAIKKTGEINLKPLKGIGRFSFQVGQDKVAVGGWFGGWLFGCDNPGLLDMWPYRGESRDYGYEFAPTSALDVSEIDASDKRLRWFKFDSEKSVKIPLSDLPK
jgi:hypothetical protein